MRPPVRHGPYHFQYLTRPAAGGSKLIDSPLSDLHGAIGSPVKPGLPRCTASLVSFAFPAAHTPSPQNNLHYSRVGEAGVVGRLAPLGRRTGCQQQNGQAQDGHSLHVVVVVFELPTSGGTEESWQVMAKGLPTGYKRRVTSPSAHDTAGSAERPLA